LFLRFILFFFIFFCFFVDSWAKFPSPADVANLITKKYRGLVSFAVEVSFEDAKGNIYMAQYWQRKRDLKIIWKKKDRDKFVSLLIGILNSNQIKTYPPLKDFPVLPFSLEDFVAPYRVWNVLGLDLTVTSYDFVDHMPCVVIGGSFNKVFIDIENYVTRKKIIGNKTYLFRNFVHIGNYFFPTSVEVICEGMIFHGKIEWKNINNLSTNPFKQILKQEGGPSIMGNIEPPLFKCLPTVAVNFLYK